MRKKALLLIPAVVMPLVGNGLQVKAMSSISTSISENGLEKSISEIDIDFEKLKEDGKRYLDNVAISNSDKRLLKSDESNFADWLGALCTKDTIMSVVKWGAPKLLSLMFSSDDNSKILEKMDRIISDISCLRNQLGQIEDSIVDLTNINQLNEFLSKSWSTEGSMRTIYGAMRALDGKNDEENRERVIRERKELMAYGATGIPKQLLHGSLTDFDKEVMQYVDALRKQYIVAFGPKTAELFEIYHQHLKNKYHWEHQAYKEWSDFQEYCMITGVQSIWLDCLSLKARIEEIEDHNKQCQPSEKISTLLLEERLKELDAILKDLKNMWDKNKIDKRKPNERYFWTPKKEMLLLVAKDKYKECPRDDENYGVNKFVICYESPDHGAYSEYYGSQADVQVYTFLETIYYVRCKK